WASGATSRIIAPLTFAPLAIGAAGSLQRESGPRFAANGPSGRRQLPLNASAVAGGSDHGCGEIDRDGRNTVASAYDVGNLEHNPIEVGAALRQAVIERGAAHEARDVVARGRALSLHVHLIQ